MNNSIIKRWWKNQPWTKRFLNRMQMERAISDKKHSTIDEAKILGIGA